MSGLYIHLPVCRNKCHYCGFMSITQFDIHLLEKYFEALILDILSTGKTDFETAYIGGGTPSAVPANILDKFLNKLFRTVKVNSEFTVEANPESLNEDFLKVIKLYGANRLSMGCQSTNDDVLKILGRIHNKKTIYKAYDCARKHLADADINLDLIFDIPSTHHSIARKSAEDIVAMAPEHISAYSYSFDTHHIRKDSEVSKSDFLGVKQFLQKNDYLKYEISNFSKNGHESKHNINYWQLGDYSGIGAAAWSLENFHDKRILKGKPKDLNIYMSNPSYYEETSETFLDELVKETLVFGLRMTGGVDFTALTEKYNYTDADLNEKIGRLCGEGLLEWTTERVIALTERGELLADSVSEFLW